MSNEWIKNITGVCPVDKGTLIDAMHRDGEEYFNVEALSHRAVQSDNWIIYDLDGDVTHWRLHKPELALEDAFDEPDSVPWAEAAAYHQGEKIVSADDPILYKYPTTKPVAAKKSIEQLAIDVLYNTTGKLYTEREIVAVVSIVQALHQLES